jgi:hypothetical protein
MKRLGRIKVLLIVACVMAWGMEAGWSVTVQPLKGLGQVSPVLQDPVPSGPPAIIWFHAVKSNSMESLRTALASRLPNHVMISYMHRRDADWQKSQEALEAIDLVKKSGARLIWCRDLWPYYKNQGIGESVLIDPNYYVQEIRTLRTEAVAMKADAVALDVEPYGHSPLKPLFKSGLKLSRQNLKAMAQAIQSAIQQTGQVEFVLPAGSLQKDHPYNLLSRLGVLRISEHTYYQDGGTVRPVPYPFEIFGAHVSGRKWSFAPTGKSCFLVDELFDRSQVWSAKQGLFLFASGPDSPSVAKALQDYTKAILQRQEARSKKQ